MRIQAVPCLLLALGACGDGPKTITLDPDAPVDTSPGETISIDTNAPPRFVAVRDGDTPWQVLPVSGARYEAEVHGPYVVAVVCDDGFFYDVYQLARTLDDPRESSVYCYTDDGGFTSHRVTGSMQQPGTVTVGYLRRDSETPAWDFDVELGQGVWDLVATGNDRVAIRRDLEVLDDLAIAPRVDVAQQGQPLVPAGVSITNPRAGEFAYADVRLYTPGAFFATVFGGELANARLAGDDVLLASDLQELTVSSYEGNYVRSHTVDDFRAGDPGALELPAPLVGVDLATSGDTQVVATWQTAPALDSLSLWLYAFSDDGQRVWFHNLEQSASYVAQAGSKAALNTDAPGFLDEWRIDFTKEHYRILEATRAVPGGRLVASFSEAVNAASATTARQSSERFASRKRSISAKKRLGSSYITK